MNGVPLAGGPGSANGQPGWGGAMGAVGPTPSSPEGITLLAINKKSGLIGLLHFFFFEFSFFVMFTDCFEYKYTWYIYLFFAHMAGNQQKIGVDWSVAFFFFLFFRLCFFRDVY